MSTSGVKQQQSYRKLSSSNRSSLLLFLLCTSLLILLAANLTEAAIDVFTDDECNFNPMRKPPRFGKRSHNVADMTSDDQMLLGVDPAAWPSAVDTASSSSGPRSRRSNCIRGPLRRRTLRGSPTDFVLAAGHLKATGDLKRFLKLAEEGKDGIEGGENSGNVNPVEAFIIENAKNSGSGSGNSEVTQRGENGNSSGGSRLTDDLLLIARLRARFPKAMRSLEAVVKEFKALDNSSSHGTRNGFRRPVDA